MSQNIQQIYAANPASSMVSNDLLYLGRSPYAVNDDFAIQWTDMQQSITAVGTVTSGVWHGTLISPTYGGTGINNGNNTLAYQGNVQFIGAFSLQVTLTGATSVQLPTGGILLNSNLTSANFFVGNAGNIATGVAMSGDASLANTGAVTVSSIGGKAVTLGGTLTTSGNFNTTFVMTGATNVTFPTSGTLATTASASGVINSGTINQLAYYAASGTTLSGLATANSATLYTTTAGAPTFTGSMTNGQLLVGSTGANPVLATISAGTGVTVTNGAGSITIAATGASPWVDQTTASVTMAANTGYTADAGASLITFTLPTTSAIGDWVEINGKAAGLWTIAQAAGQQIFVAASSTTLGATGTLSSVNAHDCVRLRCITANTTWDVVAQQSTGLTIV